MKINKNNFTRNLQFQAIHIQSRKFDIRLVTPESFPATVLGFSFEIIKNKLHTILIMNEMSFEINKKFLTGSPQFHAIHIQSYFRFSTPDIFPATVFAIFIEIIYI